MTARKPAALESLRDLIARSRMELPKGLPPMTAGVFGAIGYDMVRLVERLPGVNPDPLGLPDGIMTRPSIVAIFDAIGQEIILTTTVRPTSCAGPWPPSKPTRRRRRAAERGDRATWPSRCRGEPT